MDQRKPLEIPITTTTINPARPYESALGSRKRSASSIGIIHKQRPPLHPVGKPPEEPAVNGVSWTCLDDDRFPEKPYLSILEFALIHSTEADSPFQTRWSAVVDYITTIPGLVSIAWGPTREDPAIFRCWIQWQNGKAWGSFQKSLGYQLIIPFCVSPSNPLNWTVQTDILELASPNKVIQEFSFTFQEGFDKEEFEKLWLKSVESSVAFHGWVEPPVSECLAHDECKLLSKTETIFVGLLLLNESDSFQDPEALVALVTQGMSIKPVISSRTAYLCSKSHKEPTITLGDSTTTITDSFASLLRLQPTRNFTQIETIDLNKLYFDSLDQLSLKTGQRLYPAPNGSFNCAVGRIKEIRTYGNKSPLSYWDVLSILWLDFKPSLIGAQGYANIIALVNELRVAVRDRCNKPSIVLGIGNPQGSVVGLIALWQHDKYQQAYSKEFNDLINLYALPYKEDFASSPQLHTFTIRNLMLLQQNHTSTVPCFGLKFSTEMIEFVTFYIYPSLVVRELLEKALKSYLDTLTSATDTQYPRPFRPCSWAEDLNKNSLDCWSYTIAFKWENPPGGWYQDFANGIPVYHQLGYRIDALKLCFVKPAVSRFFHIEVPRQD